MKLIVFALLLSSAFAQFPRITTKGGLVAKGILDRDAATLSAPDDVDFFDINQRQLLNDLIDGDIKPRSKDGYNGIVDSSLYWPTTIPVKYSALMSMLAISGIEDARLEYEMRTCLNFVDRTDEANYISFEPRSGCYSSVGCVGGGQTISIGSGCEKMSTIVHEIMHALGIYHEQSRTDRDDYITIMTENIDSSKLHNFNTYKYDYVDDNRISYDYNSVMHYSDMGFSNNGEKTIVTIDPAYQDVIGQRRTFSPSDATLINRMYPCGDPLRHSYSCGFEESTACGYVQDTSDNIDWIRYDLANLDGNPLPVGSPSSETTLSKSGEGSFMMLDQSGKKAGDLAYMRSMRLQSKSTVQCLEFSYYMDLGADSDAGLGVYLASIDALEGTVLSTEPIVTITGDHQNYWNVERLTIQAPSKYKLVFAAKTSADPTDVIAIDDIHILDKACDTNYFVINDFANLLDNTVKGDGFYSPLMYDDDGYAFKLLFYPHGTSSATDGYWSMYFAVAQGDNDDNLAWPYYNRVLKIKIVDQNAKVIERMGQYSQFITSSSGGSWDQPTSSQNGAYGYSTFMPISDILNTMEFIKNDRMIISVNVKDMTDFARNNPARFGQMPSQNAEPQQMSVQERDHDDDLEDHKKQPRDINVNVVMPETKDEVDTVPIGTAVAAVIGCVVGVFLVMAMLMMCMNQSHQSAINAMAFASQKFGDRKGKINEHYSMDKV